MPLYASAMETNAGIYRSGESDSAPADELGRYVIQTMQSAFVQKVQALSKSASFNLTYAA